MLIIQRFSVAFGRGKRSYGFFKYKPPPGGYSPLSDALVTELVSYCVNHVIIM